jgi:acyl carrier protein
MTDELRTLIADILGIDASRIGPDSGPGTIDNWDSLAHLSIVTAVEERFGVRFSMTDVREISTFGALESALRARLNL